jgi:branched-chain amino acid transport system permease protein
MVVELLSYLFAGLSLGSTYVLVALGFTLIFGVMGIMNVAHADVFMIAIFTYLLITTGFDLPTGLGVVIAIFAGALAGLIVYWLVLKRIDKGHPVALFVSTLGVSYVVENFIAKRINFGRPSLEPIFGSDPIIVGGVVFTGPRLLLFAVTAILAGGLIFWLKKSETGMLLRAVSENAVMARVVAIDTNRVTMIAIAVASFVAACGGLVVGNMTLTADAFVANSLSLKMFAVAVVAGIGSVGGATIVGLTLGVIEAFTVAYVGSQWQNVIGLVAMTVVLLVRPQGLFGRVLRVG